MNYKKELFDIFQTSESNYELYVNTCEFVKSVIADTKGEENAKFYDIITKLQNSINNVDWQERRSDQIHFLNKISSDMCKKYENYLP